MKTFVATPEPTTIDQEIQVSGLRCFSERNWREAFLYYLNGVWSNNQSVMYRPKINLNGYTLRLDLGTMTYYAYGRLDHGAHGSGDAHVERLSRALKGETLEVLCGQNEVEIGLMRFIRNDSISELVIHFPKSAKLSFSKTTKRGEYIVHGCVGSNYLPNMEDARRFYGLDY
ncbi:MAG: hypothetical protein O3A36_03240 [bacterium]|nr:hypothetical protein [bacterium]